jgi:ubiquinone/menaquinone biosynthesis C-methylase UbiE
MVMIWIGYTTLYREGGPKFERAARTMEREKRAAHPDRVVRCERIDSKREFVDAMERVRAEGQSLEELHFMGHSGMYGPMFRTSAMPEQFSPHEWRQLSLPFAPRAEAFFHACRTARWFAPFFAQTFGVPAHGYHWYTTISTRPDRFAWEGIQTAGAHRPLYVVSCPGKKSHGLIVGVLKYAGLQPIERMKRCDPQPPEGDPTYDAVAALYDDVFADITVRADEWRWLNQRLTAAGGRPRVLDVGCGNGALLTALANRIAGGVGVDRSPRMIELARQRASGQPTLSFMTIDGPQLPFADASFDVVISLLSFRYLDWDPIMNELRRVLAPGGRILIVDMVTVPTRLGEIPQLFRSKTRQLTGHVQRPEYRRRLRAMVGDPRWKTMLKYNPIRSEHEFRWYLESRFPGRRVEVLNLGRNSRILAFDTGPLDPGWVPPQSYP